MHSAFQTVRKWTSPVYDTNPPLHKINSLFGFTKDNSWLCCPLFLLRMIIIQYEVKPVVQRQTTIPAQV